MCVTYGIVYFVDVVQLTFFLREEHHVQRAGSIPFLRLNIGLTRAYLVLTGKAVVNLALETTFYEGRLCRRSTVRPGADLFPERQCFCF